MNKKIEMNKGVKNTALELKEQFNFEKIVPLYEADFRSYYFFVGIKEDTLITFKGYFDIKEINERYYEIIDSVTEIETDEYVVSKLIRKTKNSETLSDAYKIKILEIANSYLLKKDRNNS